jgi:hypothetical protein
MGFRTWYSTHGTVRHELYLNSIAYDWRRKGSFYMTASRAAGYCVKRA